MKLYPRVALLLLLALLFSTSDIAWGSVPFQDDIGTILSQSDGSRVSLQCEYIMSIGRSGKSFGVKEFCERQPAQPRLVVVSTHPLPVSRYWSCDLEGVLSTFSGVTRNGSVFRQRILIVSARDVLIYCDQRGRPFLFPPLKGLGIEWPNKRSVADLANTGTTQAASISTMDEGSLPSLPDDPLTEEITLDNRTGLKYLPDGAYVHLCDRVVSSAFGDSFYIEEPDRSSAIRVCGMYANYPYYPSPGDLIEISGMLSTEGGERTILADSSNPAHFVIALDSGYTIPRPLGMVNKVIGGGMAGQYTQGIGSSVSLNNTGLLVTTWGKVTSDIYYDAYGSYYFIDDGSGVQDSQGHNGIKVHDNSRSPAIGDYLTLTGIAACEISAGKIASIPCILTIDYTPATSGTGTGTLSGSVTADSNAANQVVRIYGTGGSTTCTLGGNGSGTYTMSGIRAGVHTFSADLLGYTRDTAKVTITANQNSTQNFVLSGAQATIMAAAAPSTITACTGEPSAITAVAYYDSGIGCGNSIVTFQTDHGQFAADTHTQQIQVTTNAQGKAAVKLWQGSDSPGIAHITMSSTSPTASGSIDVPIVCPIPQNVSATGVGTGKIAIYWDACPNATGYEVYRGIVAGGDKSVLTGTAQPAFDGSSKMMFIDSTAADDTTYYYSVKAVYGCGTSEASSEDSAVTNNAAIPWDTRNSTSIVTAALARSPESISCPVDVIGPDGTVYTSGLSPISPPVAGPPGPEPADASLGGQMMAAATGTEPNNAHSGPFRKVESYPGYRKETAYAVLPTAVNIRVTPATYPDGTKRMKKGKLVDCPNSGDIPFMYLGSLGSHNEHVDAGLRYEPSDGKWNLFFLIGPSRTFWVFDPNMPAGADLNEYPTPSNGNPWPEFNCGTAVLLEYWCGKDKDPQNKQMKNGVWLRGTGTTGQRAVFAEVNGHPQNGSGVAMKRVSSIGQYLPVNYPATATTQYDVGYQKAGSYFLEGEWTGVQIYDMTRACYVDADHAKFKQEFPTNDIDANVVTFFMKSPYYWEQHINIDLR